VTIEIAEGAKLTVDGTEVAVPSGKQTFVTPTLDPNRVYFYEMKAAAKKDGKDVSVSKRISVKAGQTVSVKLTELKPWTAPKPDNKEETAQISVKLPKEAQLYVDGVLCPLTSAERAFDTPPLAKGKTFQYTLKAEITREGKTVSETKRISVAAGKQVAVEFEKLPVLAASR
jgi:uncharacterized protein (TIGR03000 family)